MGAVSSHFLSMQPYSHSPYFLLLTGCPLLWRPATLTLTTAVTCPFVSQMMKGALGAYRSLPWPFPNTLPPQSLVPRGAKKRKNGGRGVGAAPRSRTNLSFTPSKRPGGSKPTTGNAIECIISTQPWMSSGASCPPFQMTLS